MMQSHGEFLYIAFLAVLPESQGKGLGSRLLAHLTSEADAKALWCYLEATSPRNARLYKRWVGVGASSINARLYKRWVDVGASSIAFL